MEFMGRVLPAYREAAAAGRSRSADTFLSSDPAAVVRFGYRAGGESGNAVAAAGRFAVRKMRGNSCGARKEYHEQMFGKKPVGLWPSEGSVSDQALAIAAEEGFKWFGTDEGVLGRTLNVGFFRDAHGNAGECGKTVPAAARADGERRELSGFSATIICPTWWASCTAAWTARPRRRSAWGCAPGETVKIGQAADGLPCSWMEKMRGNIIRGMAANSCGSFTDGSATTRIFGR